MKHLVVLGATVLLAGCAASNPVLSPNAHLQQVGQEQARRDIRQCKALADQSVPPSPAEKTAYDTAIGAGSREPVPSVGGVLPPRSGTPAPPPARPTEISPAWKDVVSRCLKERGYEITGWE